MGPPRGALALGARLGAQVWWCERVFAVAGSWVPTTREASVRVHLAELSRVAGDHAVALRRHLPRPAPVDPEAWVHGGDRGAEVVDRLAAPDDSVGRLAGLHRVVLPRLLVAWAPLVRDPAPADRGVARTARAAAADLGELALEGEALLQVLVDAHPDRALRAAEVAGPLEEALAAAGGVVPPAPATLPGPPAARPPEAS